MLEKYLHLTQVTALRWMGHYHDAAIWLERHGPASDKVLHLNAGLIIWVATVMVRGRTWGDRRNLWPVVLLEGLNELADYLFPTKWTLSGTIMDIIWTLFWPVVLVLLIGGSGGGRRKRR